ncbi:hypothetical protein EPO15_14530 [bacterium]|nr:MAG: hypothetical protein EPO15_14530 [bacterium]
MKSPAFGLRVAGVIFGLMAAAQLARLLIRPQVLVAGHEMPLWPSGVAFVFMTALCLWLWRLGNSKNG